MIGYVEAPQAWGMTRGMARVLGVNLTNAILDGWMTRTELALLVDRCQECPHSRDCIGWLATVSTSATLPAYCANKLPLESLARA